MSESAPGRYDSPFEDHPGYIQFPYPMMFPHFRDWWKAAVEPLKNLTRLDFDHLDCEWQGAKKLITEYGEWAIQGVAVGDAKNDNVPLEVISWVEDCAEDYIWPQLSEKKRRLLSTVT